MLNSPGTILQQARNELGYTIDDIYSKTKIKKEYIKGLENDDVSVFPAELYYKNFLKTYALYLKLKPNELIQIYEQNKIEHQKNLFKQDKDMKNKFVLFYKNNRKLLIYFGWFVCIICLIIIIIVNLLKTDVISKKKQEQQADRSNIVVSTLTEVVPTHAEGIKQRTTKNKQKIYIKALANTWIKVIADNKDIFEGTIIDHFEYKANDEFIIKIGNINTVEVYFNDKLVDIKAGKNFKSNVRTIKLSRDKIVNLTNMLSAVIKKEQEQQADGNKIVISTLTKVVPTHAEEIRQQTEKQIKQKIYAKEASIADIIKKEPEQQADRNNIVVSTLTEAVSTQAKEIRQQTEKQIKQKIYAKEASIADIIKKEPEQQADRNNIVVSTLTEVVSTQAEGIKQQTGKNKQKIYIKALADTWIKVIADNKDIFEGTITDHFEYKANDEFIIKIGNINTVEVYFNDKLVDITSGKNFKSNVRTIKLSRNKNEQE